MPRTARIDLKQLNVVIVANKDKIYDSIGEKFWGPTNACWSEILKQLGNTTVSPKYIYNHVILKRHNILEELNLQPLHKSATENLSDTSAEEENEENGEILKFDITLAVEEWANICPSNRFYKRSDGHSSSRNYETLKLHFWTHVIHTKFFRETKLPCCVSYKRCKIHPSGLCYLQIRGNCKSCHSILRIVMENPPKPESDVVMNCTYTGNFSSCNENVRRIISKTEREDFKKKLVTEKMSPTYILNEKIQEHTTYGDSQCSSLPTTNALRCIKYKHLAKNCIDKDPIVTLSMMKGMSPYNECIRDMGNDRFFMHYWTATEVDMYRTYAKHDKIPTITIDATGGVVKNVNLVSGRTTSAIFLYEIGVMDRKNHNQFAVAHMLSEKHDNTSITSWLSEWLKYAIVPPKIVVTDQSLALMMATVKTFTQYSSLCKYLRVCSDLLKGKVNAEIPLCMIRNDFNHVMHLLSCWPEIKSSTKRIRNFYMRSFGLLIVSTDFEDVKKLLTYIFAVALHEEDGNNENNGPTSCEIAKLYLKSRIATHQSTDVVWESEIQNVNFIHDEMYENWEESETFSNVEDAMDIFEEIKSIYDYCYRDSKNTVNQGNHDNMQYNPPIAKKMLNFCELLPCWSAVMTPIFKYGNVTETSATSESLFNHLKNRIFHHETLPMRVDDFVKLHINNITGSMIF